MKSSTFGLGLRLRSHWTNFWLVENSCVYLLRSHGATLTVGPTENSNAEPFKNYDYNAIIEVNYLAGTANFDGRGVNAITV